MAGGRQVVRMACAAAAVWCVGTFAADSAPDGARFPRHGGVYPHLAMFNDEDECGTGAVMPWAGALWVITSGPHLPVGSSDKLYRIDADLTRRVCPESTGGTPANRMIHRESNQLIIGPHFIDARGRVRTIPPERMPGRLTGTARHLTDPSNKVYFATMESGLYEVDVHTLAVRTLVRENGKNDQAIARFLRRRKAPWPNGWDRAPVAAAPGYHGKGLNVGYGRIFYANNGEDSDAARRDPLTTSGSLNFLDETGNWACVRRNQFTEIATPDDVYGNEHPLTNPLWTFGFDAKSVLLMATTNGAEWTAWRLPKASHCYDGAHGWNTEWPRIRDVGEKDWMLGTMHGTFWKIPKDFSPGNPRGVRPISTYLRVIGDFCKWNGRLVFGCDDQARSSFLNVRGAKKGQRPIDRSQSNLWFVDPAALASFGPPSGDAYAWLAEDVRAGALSDPVLAAGYDELDLAVEVDGKRYPLGAYAELVELVRDGDWVRVKALKDLRRATVRLEFFPRPDASAPPRRATHPEVIFTDDDGTRYAFPNFNGDARTLCREVATERDLFYAGGVYWELPAENAGGFAKIRPIAFAPKPPRSIEARLGLVWIDGEPFALDELWNLPGADPKAASRLRPRRLPPKK